MSQPSIRLSLDVSPELNNLLDKMAQKIHTSKGDVLRRSIALMEIAVNEREKGNHVGILNQEQQLVTEIVGL